MKIMKKRRGHRKRGKYMMLKEITAKKEERKQKKRGKIVKKRGRHTDCQGIKNKRRKKKRGKQKKKEKQKRWKRK